MKKNFDPWKASKQAGQKIAKAGIEALMSGKEPDDDYYKLAIWAEMCLLDEAFPDKRKMTDLAILQRLKQCLSEEITPPKWLTLEFCTRESLTTSKRKPRNNRVIDGMKLLFQKRVDERNGIKRPLDEDSMTDFCKEMGIEGIAGEPGSYGQKAYYAARKFFFDFPRQEGQREKEVLKKMLSGE